MKYVTEPDIVMLKTDFCEDIVFCMRITPMIESRFSKQPLIKGLTYFISSEI